MTALTGERDERLFPVMIFSGPYRRSDVFVPWALLAPFEDAARSYHQQSLDRLAARGGLSIQEIACLLSGNRAQFRKATDAEAWKLVWARGAASQDEALRKAEAAITASLLTNPAFRLKPVGGPGSEMRLRQEDAIKAEDDLREALLSIRALIGGGE